MKRETIKLRRNRVSLTEYQDGGSSLDNNKLFLQSGIAGFFLSRKELEDIYTVVNYYLNIDKYSDCYVELDNEILPLIPTGE